VGGCALPGFATPLSLLTRQLIKGEFMIALHEKRKKWSARSIQATAAIAADWGQSK